jgi:exodeoxyribonuclease VII large subunit
MNGPPDRSRGQAPAGADIYSVTRLNREVRQLLEAGIAAVWIEAEVSNFARPASGHWYFSLKDQGAQLRCAMWKARNQLAGFTPREGQQVLARGRVSLYEPRGDYQLLVEYLEEAGLGALKRAFEELKARLAAEGLFAAEKKRALPAAPRRIGLITSPTGAAVRDMLHVLARRFPASAVLIYPVPVQGAAAAPAIVAALELAARRAECDVLILARGGGSLEDLWAFNDEQVARAIARSPIPVVTGIGHEVDFTIADFAADVRAPTPTAAAQLVVPDRRQWLERLDQLRLRFVAAMRRQLEDERAHLIAAQARLRLAHPGTRLTQHGQRLDELEQRLQRATARMLERVGERLHRLSARILARSPAGVVRELELRRSALGARLSLAVRTRLVAAETRLGLASHGLQAISPLATLSRGFSVVSRVADGAVVRSAAAVNPGDEIEARLASGRLRARVTRQDLA